jgi:integrase
MRGNITRRGKSSWRLKFDVGADEHGKRRIRYVTVKGKRADAQAELARLLNEHHRGTLVDPTKMTVGEYLRSWLDSKADITNLTRERYAEIIDHRINPVLGSVELQKLKPKQVHDWLSRLTKSGGLRYGQGLSARTVRHCYRVLSGALKQAVKLEMLSRNVADVVTPPKLKNDEVEILTPDQIRAVRDALKEHRLYPIISLGLATGCRMGELLALRWSDVDANSVRIGRSLEQTKAGLRFKDPKTRHGRRTISLPPSAARELEQHRRQQLELRLRLGMGRPERDALVFCNYDGSPIKPNNLSVTWNREIRRIDGVAPVTFHSLRHCHASALIRDGIDVVSVSKRLGHSSPVITLKVYAHLFGGGSEDRAAEAIERMLR